MKRKEITLRLSTYEANRLLGMMRRVAMYKLRPSIVTWRLITRLEQGLGRASK
jgi:hypothetical protein